MHQLRKHPILNTALALLFISYVPCLAQECPQHDLETSSSKIGSTIIDTKWEQKTLIHSHNFVDIRLHFEYSLKSISPKGASKVVIGGRVCRLHFQERRDDEEDSPAREHEPTQGGRQVKEQECPQLQDIPQEVRACEVGPLPSRVGCARRTGFSNRLMAQSDRHPLGRTI